MHPELFLARRNKRGAAKIAEVANAFVT